MAKISWINGDGGSWTSGSNWSNGQVPGPGADVTIAIAPGIGVTAYTVDLADTAVTVHSLTLDQEAATLQVGDGTDPSSLTTNLDLEAGVLALETGTLTGTVTQTGGQFVVEASGYYDSGEGTLQSVRWQGDLNPIGYAGFLESTQLTIAGSLTLTGVNGSGPGTLTLNQPNLDIYFAGQQTLDNATVYLGAPTEYDEYEPSISGDTLTLGQHLTIDVTGDAVIGGGEITNDGAISTSGSATLTVGGTFTNAAEFDVATSGTLVLTDGTFDNTGMVTIAPGAAVEIDQTTGGTVGITGSIVENGALILSGTLSTSALPDLLPHFTFGADATIVLAGTLVNTGADLTVGAGGTVPFLVVQGTLQGGTLNALGNNVLQFQNGTLDGVTVDGPFALTAADETLSIVDGITLGSGTMSVIGANDTVTVLDTETLENAVIVLGSSGGDTLAAGTFNNEISTLTLGASTQVQLDGGSGNLGGLYAQGDIVAQGNIAVSGGATLSIGMDDSQVLNQGTISVTGRSTLFLDSGFSTTGSVAVQGSTLALGNVGASLLNAVSLADSTVAVVGTLTATGSTLNVGTGSYLGDIRVGGIDPDTGISDATIIGGTIHDAGGGVLLQDNATLIGVTYEGVLSIAAPYADVTVSGDTFTDASGANPGTLMLSGAQSVLMVAADASLDNATVDIGSDTIRQDGVTYDVPRIEGTITQGGPASLGAHLVIDQTAKYAGIGQDYALSSLASSATINATFAGGRMVLDGGTFLNAGTITVGGRELVTSLAAAFINAGDMSVAAGGTLALDLRNYYMATPLSGTSFENSGTLTLAGGIVHEESGKVLPPVPLVNDEAGVINGTGIIAAQVANYGTVTAAGGELTLSQAVSGTGGLLDVAANATLSLLGSVSSGEVAQFGGVDGVLGLSGRHFLGEIGGFAAGDTIDLLKLAANSARFSGSSIVVTLSHGGTISLALTAPGSGSLMVTGDGQGGSLIEFAGSTAAPALVPIVPDSISTAWAQPESLSARISWLDSLLAHYGH